MLDLQGLDTTLLPQRQTSLRNICKFCDRIVHHPISRHVGARATRTPTAPIITLFPKRLCPPVRIGSTDDNAWIRKFGNAILRISAERPATFRENRCLTPNTQHPPGGPDSMN